MTQRWVKLTQLWAFGGERRGPSPLFDGSYLTVIIGSGYEYVIRTCEKNPFNFPELHNRKLFLEQNKNSEFHTKKLEGQTQTSEDENKKSVLQTQLSEHENRKVPRSKYPSNNIQFELFNTRQGNTGVSVTI